MHFQIKHNKTLSASPLNGHERTFFTWQLEAADGEVLCQSPLAHDTEKDARSHIARVKKSMKGAPRYKVVSPE